MKINFWTILGLGILTTMGTNAIVNTASRIRRNKLEDENYQLEIEKKKEERAAKKAAKKEQKLEVAAKEA